MHVHVRGERNQSQQQRHKGIERRRMQFPLEGFEEQLFHFDNRGGPELSSRQIGKSGKTREPKVLLLEWALFGIVIVVVRQVDLGGQMQGAQRGQQGEIAAAASGGTGGIGGCVVQFFNILIIILIVIIIIIILFVRSRYCCCST